MRYGAAFFIIAVVIGPMIGWWSPHEAPPGEQERAAAIGGGMPAPSALHESGITSENSTPAPTVKVLPEQRPVSKSRSAVRSPRPRPPARAGVAFPAPPQTGSAESRGSVDTRMGSASRAQAQTSEPSLNSFSATATGGTDAQAGQPTPSQAPVPESPPPAPVTAPQAPSPAPVLTPPVPIHLAPPTHPLPYRMIVDAPGLSATARLEAVEARVRLRLVVRADGSVAAVHVVIPSGRRELDTAARDAARGWRFLPARRDGEPIDSVALIWVSFVAGP